MINKNKELKDKADRIKVVEKAKDKAKWNRTQTFFAYKGIGLYRNGINHLSSERNTRKFSIQTFSQRVLRIGLSLNYQMWLKG
jgi:hypothetical protein